MKWIALLLAATAARAEVEISGSHEFKFHYSYRNLNQNLDPLRTSSDVILLGSSKWIAEAGEFRLEVTPEIRAIMGTNNQLSTNNPNTIRLESPERAVDTRFHIGNPPDSFILYGDWERLNLSYNTEQFELSVGRKPLSLGVMKYLSVWNKFSRPIPGITLIPIYYGADGVIGKLKFGDWVLQASHHAYNLGVNQISSAQLIYYGEWANLHLLAGRWWNQFVWGAAIAKDALKGTFTSELLAYGNNGSTSFQWGNGYERALSDRFSFAVETLYQSAGATNSLNYNPFLNSHFQVFQASLYSWAMINFQWSHLLKSTFGGLTNWVDFGTAINIASTYSLSDSMDLGLDALIPASRDNTEFSDHTFAFGDGTGFGIPFQIVAHLDWSF